MGIVQPGEQRRHLRRRKKAEQGGTGKNEETTLKNTTRARMLQWFCGAGNDSQRSNNNIENTFQDSELNFFKESNQEDKR